MNRDNSSMSYIIAMVSLFLGCLCLAYIAAKYLSHPPSGDPRLDRIEQRLDRLEESVKNYKGIHSL